MTRSIILLTSSREVPYFKDFLLARNSQLKIIAAHSREELAAAVNRTNGATRVISFVTDVIIPENILSRLTLTPYNIHPGPPEYPGSHADSFAIWEEAGAFGVTAHEIAPLVDSGPIVAVHRFPMPQSPERIALANLVYARAVEVFAVVAAHCAECDEPMPTMPEEYWSDVKRTRAQFKALCDRVSRVTGSDAERLRRACGPSVAGQSRADASNG